MKVYRIQDRHGLGPFHRDARGRGVNLRAELSLFFPNPEPGEFCGWGYRDLTGISRLAEGLERKWTDEGFFVVMLNAHRILWEDDVRKEVLFVCRRPLALAAIRLPWPCRS